MVLTRYGAGVITNLQVEWVGDELRAQWQGGTDPTVFVSASADDAGTVIVPVETPGRLRIAGLPTGFRAYVHVLDLDGRWAVAGERLVRLTGHAHAVDLGGRPAAGGRTVRWGRLFASDPLDDLDAVGREVVRSLGLRTIADLRDGESSSGRPAWLEPEVRWDLPGLGEGEGRFVPIAALVALAADPAGLPLLFHDAVGSDRAVVVGAIVLSALGVADWDLPYFPTRAATLAEFRDGHASMGQALIEGSDLTEADLAALGDALLTT